jgi:hypothetical protein
MVAMTDELRALWQGRAVMETSSGWFADGYEAAMRRIEDCTDLPDNPYWRSPADESSAIPGDDTIWDEMGGPESIENARRRAFELLVLADLAQSSLPRGVADAAS